MVDLSEGGYATVDDFAAWIEPDALPTGAERLVRSASIRVANACKRDLYTDTPTGDEVAPLRDATCAQAAVWAALGVTPDMLGGTAGAVKRSKILTGEVERDTSAAAARIDEAINCLAPEAEAILEAAGLIYQPVPEADTDTVLPSFGLIRPSWSCDPSLI